MSPFYRQRGADAILRYGFLPIQTPNKIMGENSIDEAGSG